MVLNVLFQVIIAIVGRSSNEIGLVSTAGYTTAPLGVFAMRAGGRHVEQPDCSW
jgi:hypothetical protein